MHRPPCSSFLFGLLLFPLIPSCHSDKVRRAPSTVRVHKISDPDGLNPVTSRGSDALEIQRQLFQRLLDYDPQSEELAPVLADSLPTPETLNDSTVRIAYRIRTRAEWDDGTSITAKDVVFTLRSAFLPGVKNEHKRPYLQRIREVRTDEGSPKTVEFICDRYIQNVHATGAELAILPSHLLDPNDLLQKLTLSELRSRSDSIKKIPGITKMVASLNEKGLKSRKWEGSGPYILQEWDRGSKIVLRKKEDWWGEDLELVPNAYFEAHPQRIEHRIITDRNSAVQALKSEELDVMGKIPSDRYHSLKASESFRKKFKAYIAPQLGYSYIALRMENPLLRERKTRQALAHLVDRRRIREQLGGGHGRFLVGPVHPEKESIYNDTLTPYELDRQKARELLSGAGWQDQNNDGVLEKRIGGKERELRLEYLYNSGSEVRKKIGLLLKEEARKLGVRIELRPAEWSLYQELMANGDFQLAIGGYVLPNAPQDPKQLFHTSAMNGGSNHAGFGNARTDSLIDSLRVTMKKDRRKTYWYALQEAIHHELPMIFLQTYVNRIAIHRRFGKVHTTRIVPGFWAASLRDTGSAKKLQRTNGAP